VKLFYLCAFVLLNLLNLVANAAENPNVQKNESIQELDEVVVNSNKDPAEVSYREILKALDAYEKHRGLAPFAQPRFKIRLNPKQWDASREPLTLHLIGNNTAIDIPVAADKTFTLPRIQQAVDDDAKLVLNRSKALYRFVSWIESPNVPTNARRLGDLRLQCEMNWAFIDLGPILRAAANPFGNPCHSNLLNISFLAPRPLAAAFLSFGNRHEPLPQKNIMRNRLGFMPPLNDQRWPDDTLIEFEFAPSTETR